MTQKEFEERTGIKMDAEKFNQVHDIYMAVGDSVDKDTFCGLWKVGNFRALLTKATDEKKITELAYEMAMNKIERMKEQQMTQNMDYAYFLLGKAEAHQDTDFRREAVKLIGEKEVVMAKLRLGLPMWEDDKAYIVDNLR